MPLKIALCFPRFKYPTGDPPLGVAYLAAILKRDTDAEVTLIDTSFSHNPMALVKSYLNNTQYDIFGISSLTSMLSATLEICKLVKATSPQTQLIVGGPHPTVNPEGVLKYPEVDAICQGEAEYTIVDLVKNNAAFEGVNGITYKKNNEIIQNEPRPFIKDLDSIPFPALELLDIERYFQNWFQLDCISVNLRGTTHIASRGCPFHCSFCQPTLDKLFGKKIRYHSPQYIMEKLKYCIDKFKITAAAFQDDTFIVNKKWVYEICDEFERQKVDLIWSCNVRADLVDRDLLERMKSVGLRKIAVGIETSSPRILEDIYHKGITLDNVARCVDIGHQLGLKVQGFFMLGAPTETEAEINKTITFARRLNLTDASFSITTPLIHTHLYDMSKELIGLPMDKFDYYRTSVYNSPKVVSQRKLNYYKRKAFFTFYFHPKRLLSTLGLFVSLSGLRKTLLKMKRL